MGRLLIPGCSQPPLSSMISRKHLETCSQKTELPEQWTSRKTLLPKLKSSRLMPQQNWNFFPKVLAFDKNCVNYLKVLTAAEAASKLMTTHTEADAEVAALKARFDEVKGVSDTWVKKVDTLVKEWVLLDNTVVELNSWVAKDKSAEGENQFSLEKMESTLGELKNIFKQKEKLVDGL